jgi:hypothetical protein
MSFQIIYVICNDFKQKTTEIVKNQWLNEVKLFYLDTISAAIQTKKNIAKNPTNRANGIHNGDVTHHQDQSIVFVNLRIRKTINKTVPNPKPFVLTSFWLLIF